MAVDQDKKPTTSKSSTAKATAKKPATKKPATKRTAAKKSTPAKGVNAKKATSAKPSAPLKAGATRAASGKTANATADLKERAIDKARSTANDGKAKAGEAISTLSEMIENSAKTIDENVGEKYGNYARSAADSISSFAEKINTKDVDEMVDDAREFVRKKPAVAIGAAAVVGLIVARLIKSGIDDRG
jgi:ElaB/YqjD/DUF883 family membrane-anchored ribosome-binding protein